MVYWRLVGAGVMNDFAFEKTRKVLLSKQKELKKKGKGNKPNAFGGFKLSTVSIFSSTRKSNRCFNNILTLDYSQSIHRFNLFFNWKVQALFKNFFGLEL